MATDSNTSDRERFAETRKSLIEKLANWEDQQSWEEFYRTYWRLIYGVSLKAGLGQDEALEVVQETILSVARQWKEGSPYDPDKGSFKTWLLNITRWRIADQFRRRQRDPAARSQSGNRRDADGGTRRTATVEGLEDESGTDVLERLWEREWKENIARLAIESVKKRISPKQFQIFDAYVIKGWEADRVSHELGVSIAQVYLAKHRVGSEVRKEAEKLRGKL